MSRRESESLLNSTEKGEKWYATLCCGGNGPPVLLLHDNPQTHVCWHRVAPVLAERFTVICADLRGCGDSDKPPSDPEHLAYSKRVMAQDQVEVMQSLGFSDIAVVGHDRCARVAHRMAIDHREKITKLALLDIIPTRTAFANVNREMATKDALAAEAVAEYERCFDDETIRATCEEFRSAATIDFIHDEADEALKISCPTLVLWGAASMWASYDILEIWRARAADVQGAALDGGHFCQRKIQNEQRQN